MHREDTAVMSAPARRPAAAAHRQLRTRRCATPPPPRRGLLRLALAVTGTGFGVSIGLALTSETRAGLSARGGILMFLGNLTGLSGTYLALVMVLLVSRLPAVERILGQDGLLAWHRRLSPWPISLIVAHAVLLTFAYAEASRTGALHQLYLFLTSYSGMLIAVVGFVVLVVAAVASIYSVRRRLRRETWWAIHLGMYLALALAFAHQIALGPSFVGHPLTTAVWSAAWAASAGIVLLFRFGLPLWRSIRHALRVVEVRPEGGDVVSVIIRGRRLERLRVAGGQFCEWRFLRRGLWWQAHPYSLSALPQPPYLRLTVRGVGDHSRALAQLRPGTRVLMEGPYGAFTARHATRRKIACVTAGIGVTSVRALLEDLGPACEPAVIWRVATASEAVLSDEVRDLVSAAGGTLHLVPGGRRDYPIARLLRLVPDLRRRDVYVSGSDRFVRDVVVALEHERVPRSAIHAEVYAL